jgi:pimeloyl-ACP methyl ester carboxylesterase
MRQKNKRMFYACALPCLLALVILTPRSALAQAASQPPRFEAADCPIDVPQEPVVTCGYLVVPENYEEPAAASVRLPVIILHSRSVRPAPDPILFTEGGPGYSSLGAVWYFANSEFVNKHDVIILEQRGNRYAQPSLICDFSVWWEEGGERTPCLDKLVSEGIDLSHYTTQAIVADIQSLRQALDYDQWNLMGGSYSTRLMLLTMQLYPQGIRSVILQSVSPPNETRYRHDPEHTARAISVLLDDCAADPKCAAAYPNLEGQLYALIARLNAQPVPFEFTNSQTGERIFLTVTGNTLIEWMATDAFYGPAYPPHKTAYLPLLIDQVEQGQTELLYPWLKAQLSVWSQPNFAWGLYFAVNCQGEYHLADPQILVSQAAAHPELQGYIRHQTELAICDAWQLSPSRPAMVEPVTSDIPTLILAGSYDPITPPEWSQTVAAGLSNSYYYEFRSAGHNIGNDNPCAKGLKLAFLDNPNHATEDSCMADRPKPSFVLPDEVLIAPGFFRSLEEVNLGVPEQGELLPELVTAGAIILFLIQIVFALIAGINWWRRRQIETVSDRFLVIANVTATVLAILGFITGMLLTTINNHYLRNARLVLHFGLSPDYPPVIALAIIAIALTLLGPVMLLLAGLAWRRQVWRLPRRLFFTLMTVVALAFIGLLARWDLLSLLL